MLFAHTSFPSTYELTFSFRHSNSAVHSAMPELDHLTTHHGTTRGGPGPWESACSYLRSIFVTPCTSYRIRGHLWMCISRYFYICLGPMESTLSLSRHKISAMYVIRVRRVILRGFLYLEMEFFFPCGHAFS